MSAATESRGGSGIKKQLLEVYYAMRQTVSLTAVLFGVFLLVLGSTVVESISPVMAGVFGIWGTAIIVVGLLAYLILWLNKTYFD